MTQLRLRLLQGFAVLSILISMLAFQNCGSEFQSQDAKLSVSDDENSQGVDEEFNPNIEDEDNSSEPVPVDCPIENGTGEIHGDSCEVVSCDMGYRSSGNQCVPSAKSCPILYGDGIIREDGHCVVERCHEGYHSEANNCISDLRFCKVPHGAGEQTWNGSQYGPCQVLSCDSGYQKSMNQCVGKALAAVTQKTFAFRRGTPIRLSFTFAKALSSDLKAEYMVENIRSSDFLLSRLYTKDALNRGSKVVFSAKKGAKSASVLIASANRPLRGKTVFELSRTSSSSLLPQKLLISIEPKPSDIVEVFESRRGASGPNGCFARTYSGRLLTNESATGTKGLCPLNGKVSGPSWKPLNSATDSKVQRVQGVVAHYTYAFSEVFKDGRRILNSRFWQGKNKDKVLPVEHSNYNVPFAHFHQGNYGLAAVHKTPSHFFYGVSKREHERLKAKGIPSRIFGQVLYSSPVGKITHLYTTSTGRHLLAIDATKKAHIIVIKDLGNPDSVRIAKTLTLGANVLSVDTGIQFAALLTGNKRVYIRSLGTADAVLKGPGIIHLPAEKTPISVRVFLGRVGVLFADGSTRFYEIGQNGFDGVTGKFHSKYLGYTNSHGFFVRGHDLVYDAVTNTFIRPTLK